LQLVHVAVLRSLILIDLIDVILSLLQLVHIAVLRNLILVDLVDIVGGLTVSYAW